MALDQDIDRLARIPLLGVLDPGALRLIAFSGETRILRAGDVLFRQDERSDGSFFVLSGAFSLNDGQGPAGSAPRFSAGVLLGEIALIRETARPATAVALETSTVLKISRSLFRRVLKEHPGSADRVQAFLARRVRETLALDDLTS